MAKDEKRNYALDLLRIFCCYCVIMIHVSGHLDLNGTLWRLVQGIVRPALWRFIILSGYFILPNPITDWKKFYFKHLLHLIIPLMIYVFVYQLYYSQGKSISFLSVIAGDSIGHLWFVYSLIVLYLIAPFLQKLLMNLNNIQLNGLLILMFFCGRIIKILAALGIPIGIPVTVIGDCTIFFFILGYRLSRIEINISCNIIVLMIVVNILYSAYTFSNPILVNGAAELALSMIIGSVLYYLLFLKIYKGRYPIFSKIIAFVSMRTYGIYLIHMLIFQYFTTNGILLLESNPYQNIWILPLKCLIIFLLGLIFASIIDLLICKPLEKFGNYIYKKVSSNKLHL